LHVEEVMELLDICVTTKYFQSGDIFYQIKRRYGNGKLLNAYGHQKEYICGKVRESSIRYSRPQNR
jgi:hypothetical protein